MKLRPSSAPGIANDSWSFQKELLGPEVRNGSFASLLAGLLHVRYSPDSASERTSTEVGEVPGPTWRRAVFYHFIGPVRLVLLTLSCQLRELRL
jgi:hypothetical protein